MDHLEGAGLARGDRVDFDRRVRLEFRGAQISSDGGLLVMRELDDVLGLSNLASEALRDSRRSGRKTLAQRAKSGDLEVKRQATWGMSVSAHLQCLFSFNWLGNLSVGGA